MKPIMFILFILSTTSFVFANEGIYEGISSSAYRDCFKVSRPDHAVWFKARKSLEEEAIQAAKKLCRLDGKNVCEVLSVGVGQRGSRCVGEAFVSGGVIESYGPETLFERSSRTGYRDCYKIGNPDHLVWYEARAQMEDEATRSATMACKRAGFRVCEITYLSHRMKNSRCVMEAIAQGGN